MCSAVRRRMLSNGVRSSPVAGEAATGGRGTGRGTDRASGAPRAPSPDRDAASTSRRVIRPPSPLPVKVEGSSPRSSIRRRTTGDVTRESAPDRPVAEGAAAGTGAGEGAGAAGGEGAAAGGKGEGAGGGGAGAGACGAAGAGGGEAAAGGAGGSGGAAGAAAGGAADVGAGVAPSPSSTARRAPTSTVSPSGTTISVSTPAAGDGTSETTLSVDTSNSGPSTATHSPPALSHRGFFPSGPACPSLRLPARTR